MKKFLFSSIVALLLSSTTFAAPATCNLITDDSSVQVAANFNELTVAAFPNGQIEKFNLRSERVSPDSYIEFIEIQGYNENECVREFLFSEDNSANIGVKSVCHNKKTVVSVSCIYAD
ncbi:MAG: hypothetical protein H7Z71_10465 [Moraxellaceae bacterium]|nr:hypothetical protein [Pseudobdellovibrionaceae bacterium]